MHIERELFYFSTDLRHTDSFDGSTLGRKVKAFLRYVCAKRSMYSARFILFVTQKKNFRHVHRSTFALTSVRDINSRDGFFHNPRAPFSRSFPRRISALQPCSLFINRSVRLVASSCSHHYSQIGYFAVFVLRRDVITMLQRRRRSWLRDERSRITRSRRYSRRRGNNSAFGASKCLLPFFILFLALTLSRIALSFSRGTCKTRLLLPVIVPSFRSKFSIETSFVSPSSPRGDRSCGAVHRLALARTAAQ